MVKLEEREAYNKKQREKPTELRGVNMAGKNKISPVEISMRCLKSAAQRKTDKMSYSGSNVSLTPSDLNDAIMGMLQINTRVEPCRRICLGNPITIVGQRKQMAKMMVVVMFPLAILTAITAVDFSKSLTRYVNTDAVMDRLNFGIELGYFLTALQKERDMSSLYASRIGTDTKRDLLLAYPETDESLDKLSSWPVSPTNSKREFQTRERYINHINRHRYELDAKNLTVIAEIDYYSQDIEIFIRWMYDAVSEVDTSVIWKSLVGYQELIMAMEYVGRERGYGIYFFAVGTFRDRDHYLRFLESQDIAKAHFESAKQYSRASYAMFLSFLYAKNDSLQEIGRMRDEVRTNNSSEPDGSIDYAKWWFANMSIYRDVMKKTQEALTAKINKMLAANSVNDLTGMSVAGAIFVGIMIIGPMISIAVYMLTSNIQKYSLSIARKTKALNKEKKQSEAILYQMLPKPVAECLKQNETVDAEQFEECTILQNDIVGFTRISANCSPLQVTQMLNILFSCFDSRIALYDVYKVETIGDGYMVASGVPRRNGIRHAAEIATLSLDILFHMNKLELPQNPGEKYVIRMGCHTGPVVAGVVGSKNPRYCLFGTTVRGVGVMEASGEANKIQLSETTQKLLTTIGGFEIIERESLNLEVKKELYGLGISQKTYWLLRKEHQEWSDAANSVCSDSASLSSSL